VRTIDPEHNWFWQQGYQDGLDGLRAIAPDETRRLFQRSDYFAGYEAGQEDREDMLRASLEATP
jgi:ribosome modulation factor